MLPCLLKNIDNQAKNCHSLGALTFLFFLLCPYAFLLPEEPSTKNIMK